MLISLVNSKNGAKLWALELQMLSFAHNLCNANLTKFHGNEPHKTNLSRNDFTDWHQDSVYSGADEGKWAMVWKTGAKVFLFILVGGMDIWNITNNLQ